MHVAWDDERTPKSGRKMTESGLAKSHFQRSIRQSIKKYERDSTVATRRRLYQEKLRQGLTIEFKDIDCDLLLEEVTRKTNQYFEGNRNFKRLLMMIEGLTERLKIIGPILIAILGKNQDEIISKGVISMTIFKQVLAYRPQMDKGPDIAVQRAEFQARLTEELSQFSVNLGDFLLKGRLDTIHHTVSKMEDYHAKLSKRALDLLTRTGIKDLKKVDFILSLTHPKLPSYTPGHVIPQLENLHGSAGTILHADARATHYALEEAFHKFRDLETRSNAHIALFQSLS
eukprot:TRINITY_DN22190_c0_g1_i2.p1 TRINITY_DN22190_c0_g1~~TRINITY_DN22190_c0_g1_i2.p1  ORF type:complete len:286 (-),score=42.75 TRINITY_DN22190_c0_g1_i2:596-1453(-)